MNTLTDVVSLLSDFEILDQSSQPFFIKNDKGSFCYCNDTFSKQIGISKNKILGSTVFDLFPVANAKVYSAADLELFAKASLKQEYVGPIKLANANANSVTFKKNLLFSNEGTVAGYLGTFILEPESMALSNDTNNKLTKKEITVLNYLAQGLSTKKISKALMISDHTAASHMKSIYAKLNVHSKSEAVYKALIKLQC